MTVTEEYDYDARAEAPATGLVPGMGVAVGRDASGYGYDADGNMLTYGGWTLGWNGENRLVLASNGATRVTFAYDSMGRRFLKAVGATTNRYTYDGWAMIREADGSRTNDYAYGLDLSGSPQGAGTIGGLLMATLDGTNAFYCYDANGNVTELVDGGGNTVAAYRYDPFGNTIGKSGTLADANPFRFSTKYLDGETDLYYYGLRFYSPKLGRWISRDLAQETGSENLYVLVNNDPLGSSDFLGLWVADIHLTWTATAAFAYFTSGASSDIANYDNAVDTVFPPTSPFASDQRYHFNTTYGGAEDSRNAIAGVHLQNARDECDRGLCNDRYDASVRALGYGIHPIQDVVAHGDFPGFPWPHNWFGPTLAGAPGSTFSYVDNADLDAAGSGPDGIPSGIAVRSTNRAVFTFGSNRRARMMADTRAILADFKAFIRVSGSPCCKEKYLVSPY
jgi:RHS repeat-associated protein